MSAYVTYEGRATDINTGQFLGTFQFRTVAAPPSPAEVDGYATAFYGDDATCCEYTRTCLIGKNIGRPVPASVRVSSRVRIIA